ncbi:hypothetical protein EDB87DRAFT_1682020 [Lactarius vividus]|nr:hypothetical protein EDB87DRAFT_1682020 [Lactarius vividus]
MDLAYNFSSVELIYSVVTVATPQSFLLKTESHFPGPPTISAPVTESRKSDYKPSLWTATPLSPSLPTHFSTFKTSMVESSGSPATSSDVIGVTAPLLFGVIFNWTLFGVLCVQIYVYSYNFRTDRRFVKFLVYFVFLLETIQTALTGADIYYWFVAGFGNVERLGNSHFFPIDVPIIGIIISFIVQGYFCYRIWVLNKQTSWICWIIAVATVTQSAAGICGSIKPLTAENYASPKIAVYLWAIPSALADTLIAVAMTLLLMRESGNFSNFVLIRIVRLTIETNTLTATLVITTLVLYVAFPNERYCTYTLYVFGKIYSNTLLVSLNNRIYFRDHQPPEHDDSASSLVLDGACSAPVTTHCFTIPEPQPQALGVNFPCSVIPRPVDLDNSRECDASTNLNGSLPHLKECHQHSEDPEWVAGTCDAKDEACAL